MVISVSVTAQLPSDFIAELLKIFPFPAIFTEVIVSGITIIPPDSGRYEISIVLDGGSLDQSDPFSANSSQDDGVKTVLFSLNYADLIGNNLKTALSHYVSSDAEESFIGKMSIFL